MRELDWQNNMSNRKSKEGSHKPKDRIDHQTPASKATGFDILTSEAIVLAIKVCIRGAWLGLAVAAPAIMRNWTSHQRSGLAIYQRRIVLAIMVGGCSKILYIMRYSQNNLKVPKRQLEHLRGRKSKIVKGSWTQGNLLTDVIQVQCTISWRSVTYVCN